MDEQTPAGWRSRQDYEDWLTDMLVSGNGIYRHGPDGLAQHVPVEDFFVEPKEAPSPPK